MDSRTALQQNMLLEMDDGERYTIIKELARGGSSIVYEAFYTDNIGEKKRVRMKECYPFKCKIKRNDDGRLSIPESERKLFDQTREKLIEAYKLGNELFHTDGMTNVTANTYNVYEGNNTVYIVSAYAQGEELTYSTYPEVKDSIAIVKTVADTIAKIHNKGYLYLDIKPGNVFKLDGTTDLIQLFDFDTMVPISRISQMTELPDNKISFTKGFAAVEQQMGDFSRIGRHSDIYGVGALLFYMLFERVPDAFDCEMDAEYDFADSKLAGGSFQDKLEIRLTEFFHNTLASYYLDRYSNMETVVEHLADLVVLSDAATRFVYNSKIPKTDGFLGRAEEISWISDRFKEENSHIAVTGFGGIGKSTVVRESIRQNEALFDSIVYLNYAGSVAKTITDDVHFRINAISRDQAESMEEYFIRKMAVMQELAIGRKNLLVIDNYVAEQSGDLLELLRINWTIVLITRNKSLPVACQVLEIEGFADESALLELFEENVGRRLEADEIPFALHIIHSVAEHTLLIELIAKQIGSPVRTLSVQEACLISERFGFSNIAPEKVQYRKDSVFYQDFVKQIIQSLFETGNMSDEKRAILRAVALFGYNGIEIARLCEILEIANRDIFIALYQEGWIYIEDTVLTTHPVIAEAVFGWSLSECERNSIIKILSFLNNRLRIDAEKEEYPKHLLKHIERIDTIRNQSPHGLFSRIYNKLEEKIPAGKIVSRRIESMQKSIATDQEAVKQTLHMAMDFTRGCVRCREIQSYDVYKELLFYTIKNSSYEDEDFIREKGEEFLDLFDKNNEVMLLKLLDKLLGVYYDNGELELAELRIEQVRRMIAGNKSPYVQALFSNIIYGYYDELLDGHYDSETEEDQKLIRAMFASVNDSIKYMKRANHADTGLMLGEFYRQKALLHIRSGIGKRREIATLLANIQKLIDKYAQPTSQLVRDYYMACAWYHTYVEINYDKVLSYLENAYDITEIISKSDQERIEEYLSPAANIMLECGMLDEAAKYLLLAVILCEKHLEIAIYQRLQLVMLGHLLEIYYYMEDYEQCKTVIEVIDHNIKEEDEIEIYVSSQIREAVYTKER